MMAGVRYERVVVKIGTNLLSGAGGLDRRRVAAFVKELAGLHKAGHEIVLVTSGAIGAGMGRLGLKSRPKSLPEKQATAAVGQVMLMEAYENLFSKQKIAVGQVLLTRADLDDRQRYLNARSTLLALLEKKVVPIINENDTVAVEEIQFGDNDTLAAVVAAKVDADLLVLLTDVDGLYDRAGSGGLLKEVSEITPEIERMAQGSESERGTGGMQTKIQAAKISAASGIPIVIANGKKAGVLRDILQEKAVGTIFKPKESILHGKKRWIAFSASAHGKIVVDEGAARALKEQGRSLLASGITAVEGEFGIGDVVLVTNGEGHEIARGLSYFSGHDLRLIKGKKSDAIPAILGRSDYSEVIHRDNLVIL